MDPVDEVPIILIIGIRNSKPQNLVRSLLGNDELNVLTKESVSSYPWQICNKYYSAKLNFQICNFPEVDLSTFVRNVEAIVLYLDHVLDDFLTEVNKLDESLESIKPAIRMLVCCEEISNCKKDVVEDWCIKKKYEMIELKPAVNSKVSVIDFEESCGIDRVKEVLHAHEWSNLILKGKSSSSAVENCLKLEDIECSKNTGKGSEVDLVNNSVDDYDYETSIESMEKLSTLFNDLETVKQKISSLNGELRFLQAEKVVKTFWQAMHGDNDEFSESEDES